MLRATQPLYKTAFMLIVLFDGLAIVDPRVQILSPVKNQIIKFNQSILFNCTVSLGKDINGTLEWRRDGVLISPTKKSQYWASFEVGALQKDEEGIYECTYSNGESDHVWVCLAEKPQGWPFKFTSPISTLVDEFPTLSCFATGCPTPNINWFKNNSQITTPDKDHKYSIDTEIPQPGNRTSSLRINAVQLYDAGDYVCIALNALGSNNSTITLIVEDNDKNPLPTIEAEKPRYTAEVGTKVTLVCGGEHVKDDISTFVYWTFKGSVLSNPSKHYIVNNFFTIKAGSPPKVQTELTLLKLSYKDGGNYSCKVDTVRGIEGDIIILEVIPKDKMELWLIIVISFVVLLALTLLVLIFFLWRRRRRKQEIKAAYGKLFPQSEEETVFGCQLAGPLSLRKG